MIPGGFVGDGPFGSWEMYLWLRGRVPLGSCELYLWGRGRCTSGFVQDIPLGSCEMCLWVCGERNSNNWRVAQRVRQVSERDSEDLWRVWRELDKRYLKPVFGGRGPTLEGHRSFGLLSHDSEDYGCVLHRPQI